MKKRILAIVVVGLLVSVCFGAYTRDVSRDLDWGILYALEYMIGTGIPVTSSGTVTANAGTNLNTSALALDTSVDGLEGGLGTATTAAVDGDAAGSAVAHLRGINKKLAAGVGVTETSTATPVAKTPTHLAAVIIGTPGTPLVLAADGTFFTEATLQAGRAAAANASLISITGSTSYATQRGIELAPGESRTIRARPGTCLDLNDYRVDGVNTLDGVRIEYIAP